MRRLMLETTRAMATSTIREIMSTVIGGTGVDWSSAFPLELDYPFVVSRALVYIDGLVLSRASGRKRLVLVESTR